MTVNIIQSKMIFVTLQCEGIHKYPAASTDENLATGDEYDVSFLGYPHRHMFHFKVSISVEHDDREIEFIQFQRWIKNLYGEGVLALDNQSCEMMADALYNKINTRYPYRKVIIEISEDGENGAVCHYETKRAFVG